MRPFLITILLAVSMQAFSQDYCKLEDVRLKKKPHFIEHEKTVIKAADYLMSTPVDDKNIDRLCCTRFILRYAEKTPFITLSLDASIVTLSEDNSDILALYIGLWLKSAIKNKNKKDDFHLKYLYTEISKYCAKGNGIEKTDIVNSLIKAGETDTISDWMKELEE